MIKINWTIIGLPEDCRARKIPLHGCDVNKVRHGAFLHSKTSKNRTFAHVSSIIECIYFSLRLVDVDCILNFFAL